jgi:hypothetical protein
MAASYDILKAQIWNSVLLFLHWQITSLARMMERVIKDGIFR